MNRAALKSIKRLASQRFTTAQDTLYDAAPDPRSSARLGGNTVSINGQLYPGAVDASGVSVVNAGRPAAAYYVAQQGATVVIGGSSGGSSSGATTTATTGNVFWYQVDKTNSSIADLQYHSHALLTDLDYLNSGHIGFAGTDVENTFTASNTFTTGQTIASGTVLALSLQGTSWNLELYRPDTAFSSKVTNDGSGWYFEHGLRSADADQASLFGRASVGYFGAADWAGFSHRDHANAVNFALAQNGATGDVILNSPTSLYHRIDNADVMVVTGATVEMAATAAPTVKSDNYASQTTGWGITHPGAADFRYLYTDKLHTKVFVADLERALAGVEIITKSVTLLGADFKLPYAGASTQIVVKDLPSASGMQVFEPGDYINPPTFSRANGSLTIGDCWGTVSSPVNNGDGTQTWTFTRSGTTTYNTIAQRSSSVATAGTGVSVTLQKQTGVVNGDFLLAYIFTASTVATVPTNWISLGSASVAGGTLYVYYKFASSEPASWTWTFAANAAYAGDCKAYTNVSTYSPIDKFVFGTNGNITSLASYGVDPASAAGMLVLMGGLPANIRATPPSGMTEFADIGTTGASIYMASQLLASDAATGIKSATLASASVSAVCLLVLAPTYVSMTNLAGAAFPMTTLQSEKGQNAAVLDYGVSGNGWIEHNAIDGLYATNSPYTQIVTWTTHPLTGKAVRMRQGNLKGLGINDFGMVMGSNVASGTTTTFDFRSTTGDLSLGTSDNIVLQGNGNSYFGGVMTIGTAGEIRQGAGNAVFSAGAGNFTGLRMWNQSGVGLIGGYNAGAQQWYANTDGKLYAGAGSVQLDTKGLTVSGETLTGEPGSGSDIWNGSAATRIQTGYGEHFGYDIAFDTLSGKEYGMIIRSAGTDTSGTLSGGSSYFGYYSKLHLEALGHNGNSGVSYRTYIQIESGPEGPLNIRRITANADYFDAISSFRVGNENTSVDGRMLVNGTIEIAPQLAQTYRGGIEVDGGSTYIYSNEYYSGGWQLYNSAKAPAKIQLVSSSADSSIGFYTKAANTAQSTLRVTIDKDGNLGLGGTSFGGGTGGVMFMANRTAAPSSNPVGGGVIYAEGGALKYRGSSGTITTLAAA